MTYRLMRWTTFGAVALLLAWTVTALATAGGASDPNDTASAIDVEQVSHSNTSTTITYTLNTFDTFDSSDVLFIDWLLDVDNDGVDDVSVEVIDDDSDGDLEAFVCCNTGGNDVAGPIPVTHTNGTDTLTFTYNRSALDDTDPPLTGNSYGYAVQAADTASGNDDVPDSADPTIEHDLTTTTPSPTASPTPTPSPTPSPTPGGGTPTPTPTKSPTPTPTKSPTPSPGSGGITEARGEVNDASVTRGQKIVMTGGGFRPNSTLNITFTSTPQSLGTTTSDSSGRFSVTLTIPSNATAGVHRITVSGFTSSGGIHQVFADVTVLAAGLPQTGASATKAVKQAFVLLTLGELLIGAELFLRRQRRVRA